MLGARIIHDLEVYIEILKCFVEFRAVAEQDIVVCHTVNNQKIAVQVFRVWEHGALLVARHVFIRVP